MAFPLGLSLLKWKVIPELLEISSRLCYHVFISSPCFGLEAGDLVCFFPDRKPEQVKPATWK